MSRAALLLSLLLVWAPPGAAQENPFCDQVVDGHTWRPTAPEADVTGQGVTDINGNPINYLGACSPFPLSAPTAPAAPSGLTAVAVSSTVIQLTWSNNDLRTQSINLDRKYDVRNAWLPLTVFGLKSFFQNTNLKPGAVYCYKMKTVVDGAVSEYSNETCARTPP